MPQPIARLTSTGNFYVQGALDEATFDAASGFSKNFYTWSQDFRTSIPGQNIYQVYTPYMVSQWDPASAIAPDGTQTAVTVSNIPNMNSSFSNPNIGNIGSYLEYAGGVYTKSIYAKSIKGSPNLYFQYIEYANNAYATASFNLTTGAAANGSNSTAVGMYYVGNGWWRCWETITLPNIVASPYSIGDSFFVGGYGSTSLNTTMQFWGTQFERGGLTDYEATGASSVTLPYAGTALIPQGFTTRLNPTGFATIGSLDEVSINPRSNTSTNIFSYSTDLTNAYWTNYNDISYANAAIAPDGSRTAFLMMSIGSYPNNRPSNNITVQPYTYYTLSAYVKYGNTAQCTIGNETGSSAIASFDLTNGTNTNLAYNASNPIIRSVGNGWYRISIVIYTASYSYMDPEPFRVGAYTNQPTGAYMYCWGPQLELGTVVTDYVPTGASATPVAAFVERKSSTGLHRIAGQYDEVSLNPTSGYSRNLFSYSQQLSGSGWFLSGVTSKYGATAPDGNPTANLMIEDTSVNYSHWNADGNIYITPKTFYTLSCYYKVYSGDRQFYFTAYDAGAPGGSSYAGVVISNDGVSFVSSYISSLFTNGSYAIIPVGNGWNRAVVTFQTGPTPGLFLQFRLGLYLNGGQYYNGNGTSGLYVWGPQFELGTSATDYVATGANAIPLT
jgi:hypothetical protein